MHLAIKGKCRQVPIGRQVGPQEDGGRGRQIRFGSWRRGDRPSPGGCPGSKRTGPRSGASTARTADCGGGLSPGAGRGRFRNRLRQAEAVSPRPARAPALGAVAARRMRAQASASERAWWWSGGRGERSHTTGRAAGCPHSPWRRGRSATSRTPRPHHLLQGSAVAHGPGQAAPLPDAEPVHTAPRPVHRFRSGRFGRPAERTPTPRLISITRSRPSDHSGADGRHRADDPRPE